MVGDLMNFLFQIQNLQLLILCSGFLTNELGVTNYKLRFTIYCTTSELLFIYELCVAIYCASYELFFAYELRVITYCPSYVLYFTYELRVTIYCTSYTLNLSND